ncbi:MAG: acyl-CoA synthetase [Desulfobacteraceae bacterium]|nr:acyl-CoA synthetase [Desulfobacteraceae bacterium]
MGLEKVMHPRSVAVVGASKAETKRGYQAIRMLLDEKYEGKIYPINPKEDTILGFSCYSSVSAVEGPVDVALIATPASTVPAILEECGRKGVSGAVILAGGFRETGEAGKTLEEKIIFVAKTYNIRLIGPNTSGMLNLIDNLNLVGIRNVPRGDIALLTQSGNMALSLITEAKLKSSKGFSYYVGVGNEADIKFHEYLEFLLHDEDTRAILMYVEGMSAGREFLQQAYITTQKKPIILLKSGRTDTGRRSAGSHTGALAGMSLVAKGAFKRAGIVVIDNSDELFPVAETLSSCPPLKNGRVAILADGGGHATIAADILTEYGIEIPELSNKTQKKLLEILPAAATVTNPVDVAGGTDADPSLFADCARIILKDGAVGALLLVGLFGGYGIRFAQTLSLKEEDAAHQMGKLVKKRNKPVVIHSLFNSEHPHSLELCRYYNIPVYDSLDVACKCIDALNQYGNYLASYHAKTNFVFDWGTKAKSEGKQIIEHAIKEGRTGLLEHEAKRLLRIHGCSVAGDQLATSEEEAICFAAQIKGPIVLKVVSPDILHKSDAGGVKLNLKGIEHVRVAYSQIMENCKRYNPGADIRGVLVGPMAKQGLEVIIGTKIDEQFGPVIMYGLGGVMVEILKDISFRVLPISRFSAKSMIAETKSSPILEGVRGQSPYDQKALVNLLLQVSDIIESYPEIAEMDLNPVILHYDGLSIVDARILL